ncbi:MAG: D-alanyl-D-alanine carboxypeptidase family protein [Hyphomicrobiaceae bacterium]|nr:D-alanyl-D-alanine carboxypeptidase family protein [Hyphomicrobiaceae bacterium]
MKPVSISFCCAVVFLILSAHATGAAERARFKPESAEGQALAYLKSLSREWSGTSDHDCHTYEDKNLEALQPAFIVASAAFLKAFVTTHGAVTITSAYRSVDEQVCVCFGEKGPCAGKPVTIMTRAGPQVIKPMGISRHQMGVAMDVRPGAGTEAEFLCMQEFARLNPQLGVTFPIGRMDLPHMELAGSRGPALRLASIAPPGAAAASRITPCKTMGAMLTFEVLD